MDRDSLEEHINKNMVDYGDKIMTDKELEEAANEIPDGPVRISEIREVLATDEDLKSLYHEPWLFDGIKNAENNIN